MGDAFTPGEFWTPERARDAVRRMTLQTESPEMRAFMQSIADGMTEGADPAAMAASMAGVPAAKGEGPVRPEACTYRRGRSDDVPAFAALIVAGELPPMFIAEFVEGFVAVEHEGDLVGCGGLEVYEEDCGVIRSVVVDERCRGMRIGEKMAALLTEDALAAALTDLYLFTMHARPFWQRLGYVDVPLDAWKQAPRACWQYQFISQYPGASGDVYVMWRSIAPGKAA